MSDLASLIDSINQQIDGEALVRLTNYRPDKIQLNGRTLKCFCPVHQELAFRSLIVDLDEKTFKCMMRRCACFDGGNLVEFWSILTGKEPVEAALELADRLHLTIDKQALKTLAETHAAKARGLIDAGDLEAARGSINEALGLAPDSIDWRLLSAEIWTLAGDKAQALTDYIAVLDRSLHDEQFALAAKMLGPLLTRYPDSADLLERQVELSRCQGETQTLVESLLKQAALKEKQNLPAEALQALTEARALTPDAPELIERIAGLCETLQLIEPLKSALDDLAALHEAADAHEPLLAVLARRAALDPQDLALGRRRGALLESLGRHDDARALRLQLIEAQAAAGAADTALDDLADLLAASPDDVELLECRGRLRASGGDTEGAIADYRHLAQLAQSAQQTDQVSHYTDLALALAPRHAGLQRDRAEWKLAHGHAEEGIKDLFQLAAQLLENAQQEEGIEVLDRIAALAPADLNKRLRIGRTLERSGLEEEAYERYVDLARDLISRKLFDAAQAIGEEARRLRPHDSQTLALCVDTHLALNQKAEAIEACRVAARAGMESDDLQQAEMVLQRACKIDPDETGPAVDLARLYEATERPDDAAALWLKIGQRHYSKACFTESNVAVLEALRLVPENIEVRVQLAQGLQADGQNREAGEVWKRLAQDEFETQPDSARALGWLQRALELDPDNLTLLGETARRTLQIEGPEQAYPFAARWLTGADAQSEPVAAQDAYRWAVQQYPDAAGWRLRLAALSSQSGDTLEAADHYEALLNEYDSQDAAAAQQAEILEKLVGLLPDRLDLKVRWAQCAIALDRPDQAVQIFREVAQRHIQHEQPAAALEMIELALDIDSDHPELLRQSAELCRQLDRTRTAVTRLEHLAELNRRSTDHSSNIPVLEQLLAYRPDDVPLHAELAELYEADGDLDRAIEHTFSVARLSAGNAAGAGRTIALCERIRTLAPEYQPARELMIEALLILDRIDEAKAELDRLGDLALTAGNVDQAETYFHRIREIDPDDTGAGERLGKLYEASGRVKDAANAFTQILGVYERLSETARAIGVLKKLKSLQPDQLEVRARLARSLMTVRAERREAGEEWLALIEAAQTQQRQDVIDQTLQEVAEPFGQDWPWRARLATLLSDPCDPIPGVEAWLALARDALAARQYDTAREAAAQGLLLHPEGVSLREARIEAHRRLANVEAAAEDLRYLANRFAGEDENARAAGYLAQALELKPRDPEIMQLLIDVHLADGDVAAAREILYDLAENHRREGDLDHAIDRARQMAALAPDDQEHQDYLAGLLAEADRHDEAFAIWRAQAEHFAELGQVDTALFRYSRLLEQRPGDVRLLRRIADLQYDRGGMIGAMAHYDRLMDALHAEGDLDATETEYLRILDMEPGHLQLKERYVEFLAESGRHDEACAGWLEIVETYRDERNQPADAVRILRRLQALQSENLELREQEAVLLENMDRTEEAAAVWRKLAQTYQRQNELEQAAGCMAHCADLEPDRIQTQTDAADLFTRLGQTDQATLLLLRAVALHESAGRLDPCVDLLRQAIALNPERDDLLEKIAGVFEALDRNDDAAREWLTLGALFEQRRQPGLARPIYLHLCDLTPDAMDCRRRLASLCETLGDLPAACVQYRQLAALARRAGDGPGEAELLERIVAHHAQDEDALLRLAVAYEKLNRREERVEVLHRLEALYRSADAIDSALGVIEELKALCPHQAEPIQRAMELLIQAGRADEAAEQGADLVQLFFDRDDDQRALETLSHVAEIEPHNIERRIALCRLVQANGREQAALQEFFLLASRLFGEERHEESLAVCQAGLALFSDEVRLRDLMGRALLRLGRESEAIEVQLRLASMHDERGEGAKAQRVYESILQQQPDHLATLEAMVEWAMRHERFSLAVEHLIHLAENHYLTGALDSAIDAMERIQTIDPARLELKARLAEIYLEKGDEPGACTTWMAAARGYAERDDHPAAIELFEKARAIDPANREILEALMLAHDQAGRPEEYCALALELGDLIEHAEGAERARTIYEHLGERFPMAEEVWDRLARLYQALNNGRCAVEANYRLSRIHSAQGRHAQARTCLHAALSAAPERTDLLEELGEVELTLGTREEGLTLLARAAGLRRMAGELAEAEAICQRILKLDPHDWATRYALGEVLEQAGRHSEAIAAYHATARGYADAHETDAAIPVLAHLLALDPARDEDRELYARMLHRAGQIDESIEQALLLLAGMDDAEDPRRAIKFCRQILADRPDHVQAHGHLRDIYEREGKFRQAFQECEWLADFHQAKGDWAEAERIIRQALGWLPDELEMRTRLVKLLVEQERIPAAAVELAEVARLAEQRTDARTTLWAMQEACAIEPQNLAHHQRLADYQERQGELAPARDTRMTLIRLMLAAGQLEDARQLAERVVDSVIEDDDLRIKIATMFEEAGLPEVAAFHFHHLARRALTSEQYDVALHHAMRTIDIKPRHVGAREVLIEVLLARRENNRALEEYDRLFDLYDEASEWDGALRTLQAMIDLAPSRPGPRQKMITLYRKMHREEPMVDQLRRLVEIHVNAGDYDDAINCLRDLMAIRPEDTRARVRYIDLYTQLGDERDLMEDYLQLARILSRKGSVVESTRTYEKILQLLPEQPQCREEFIQFLFGEGQVHRGVAESRDLANLLKDIDPKEAGRVLVRALNYAPDELDLRMTLAAIYMKTNHRGQALESYRSLARQFEQAGDQDRLIEVIEQIVQIDTLNVEYRQRLVELYYQSRRHDQACEQSLMLASQYQERELFDLAEHELRRVLEIRPRDSSVWQRLVDAHCKIGSPEEILPDLIMLAELYRTEGRLKETVRVYRQILKCEPDNIDILQDYINIYMQIGLEQDLVDDYLRLASLKAANGDVGESLRIYKHLMELAPNHPEVSERLSKTQQMLRAKPAPRREPERSTGARTPSLGSDPLPSENDPTATRKLIRNYQNVLKLNDSNPTAHSKLAELSERIGDQETADRHWIRAAEQFLAKGDLERAIDICTRLIPRHPDDPPVRDILSRAQVQRDSLKAIDGALFDSL